MVWQLPTRITSSRAVLDEQYFPNAADFGGIHLHVGSTSGEDLGLPALYSVIDGNGSACEEHT
jgi:hypothetical protein